MNGKTSRTFNIVKIATFTNLIFPSKAIAIKILAAFFADINKLIQKFMWAS